MEIHRPKDTQAALRVGLLVDGFIQPRWVEKLITDIRESRIAEVVVTIKNSTSAPPPESFLAKLWSRRKSIFYAIYTRFDRALFKVEPNAFEECNLSPLLVDIPVEDIHPVRKGIANYFDDAALQRLRKYNLDVLLRFGFGILRGQALSLPQYGVWSYHHGDPDTKRGGPPGFWEVMEGNPITGSVLQKINDELDNGLFLYRSYSRTDSWSVLRNANNYYWKTAEFVVRTLRALHRNRSHIEQTKSTKTYVPYTHRLFKMPSNREMLGAAAGLLNRYTRTKIRTTFFRDQWTLAYRINPNSNKPADTYYNFRHLIPPKDRFWADPFPIKIDDVHYIFFEELPYKTGKGHISAIPVDAKGAIGPAVKVLETDFHLSYPFVFHWQNELYMMPETGSRRTIEIYRCKRFPDVWCFDRTVMKEVRAVDSTLHWSDGLWWLFVNIGCEGSSKYDELHLFFGDSPFGPWRPHAQNPICSDVRAARPAGRLFEYEGRLYRPAQDLSNTGRMAVTVNLVDQLNTCEYREHVSSRLQPYWAPRQLGCHTLNYADGLTVIDLMIRRSRM